MRSSSFLIARSEMYTAGAGPFPKARAVDDVSPRWLTIVAAASAAHAPEPGARLACAPPEPRRWRLYIDRALQVSRRHIGIAFSSTLYARQQVG